MHADSPATTQKSSQQAAQLKRCLAANATPRLRLVCKELGMAGYSRISRSGLEDLLARHLQDRPDLFPLMLGLLSGCVMTADRRSKEAGTRPRATTMTTTTTAKAMTTTTTCTVAMLVAKRPIPKLVVHRMRYDRPKESHPDEYAVLERASESGEDALFWEVAERSLFKHRDRPDIVFFVEYKICEFNIYQNNMWDALDRLQRLKSSGRCRAKYMCMALRLEHWFVRKYQSVLPDTVVVDEGNAKNQADGTISSLAKCTQMLLVMLGQSLGYLSHYDEGDSYYNLAVVEPDDDKAQQYFMLSADAFKRAQCTNEAQRSHIRLLQRITRWRQGEAPHPPEAVSASRRMLPSQCTPHLVTDVMRGIIRNLQAEDRERNMLPRTKVSFYMASADVWLRDGFLDEAEEQARRALALCRSRRWSEAHYAQERLDNITYIKQRMAIRHHHHHHHLQQQLEEDRATAQTGLLTPLVQEETAYVPFDEEQVLADLEYVCPATPRECVP